MAVTIALLQGVNVGKYKRISMADFRQIITDLGGEDARTIANSGNIAFRHDDSLDAEQLRAAVEKAVSDHVGVDIFTVTRTGQELQRIVAANPYPSVEDPKCLHVDFLDQPADQVLVDFDFGEDHLTAIGREIYMHLPNKISGATYDMKLLNKRLGAHHTSRNWSTITKLSALARELDE